MQTDLSLQQNKALEFIKAYIQQHGVAPMLNEIAEYLSVNTKSTVNQHLSALEKKGYITRLPGTPRGVIINEPEEGSLEIPLCGNVAAGKPIEAIEEYETIKVPKRVVPHFNQNYIALRVRGDSMIEDGIYDGEIVIIERRNYAQNGDLVVARDENNNVTLKYFYKEQNRVRLEPRNSKLQPIYMAECYIEGIMRGLMKPN